MKGVVTGLLKVGRATADAEDAGSDPEKRREIENLMYSFREGIVIIAGNYANFILMPQIFADRRRRAGDASASPHDYACSCGVRDPDGVPVCTGRRSNCKFAGMKTPSEYYNYDITESHRHQGEKMRIYEELLSDFASGGDFRRLFTELDRMIAKIRERNARCIKETGEAIRKHRLYA